MIAISLCIVTIIIITLGYIFFKEPIEITNMHDFILTYSVLILFSVVLGGVLDDTLKFENNNMEIENGYLVELALTDDMIPDYAIVVIEDSQYTIPLQGSKEGDHNIGRVSLHEKTNDKMQKVTLLRIKDEYFIINSKPID